MVNESCENLNLTNIEIIKNNFESAKFDQNSIDKIKSFNPHILINCAASFGPKNQEFNQIDINEFQKIININALAPMRLMQYCLESINLYQITNITSGLGSLSSSHDGGYYYYRTSKVMLNSITKNIASDLKNKKINVFCLQPGNVKTKMNSSGLITPQNSAQKIINILGENNSNFSGKLIDINRNILNW